jgi:hypothetical protein
MHLQHLADDRELKKGEAALPLGRARLVTNPGQWSGLSLRVRSRDVAARPRHARYHARGDGVSDDRHHNRNSRGRPLGSKGSRRSMGHDHVHVGTKQVGCQPWKPRIVFLRPAVLDDEVCTLDIAEVAQTRAQSGDAVWKPGRSWGRGAQEPDA